MPGQNARTSKNLNPDIGIRAPNALILGALVSEIAFKSVDLTQKETDTGPFRRDPWVRGQMTYFENVK